MFGESQLFVRGSCVFSECSSVQVRSCDFCMCMFALSNVGDDVSGAVSTNGKLGDGGCLRCC